MTTEYVTTGPHYPSKYTTFDDLIHQCHSIAIEKGWWSTERTIPEQLCLIHSEISEALEDYRNNKPLTEIHYDNDGKPHGFPIELADTIIRILDLCGKHNIDLQTAIMAKLDYNKTRPFRHGNKKA